MTNLPELMSMDELSAYLGVPKNTLYQWRTRDYGPPGFPVGRYVRYLVTDVQEWVRNRAKEVA